MTDTKTALVTGASRGIGRAILLRLAEDGFDVVGTATAEAGVQSIRASLEQNHRSGRAYAVRLDDAASVKHFIEQLAADGVTPLVLVNNAGETRDNLLLRMGNDEWDRVIATNLGSLYHLCKPLLRGMTRARWGRIINVSSVVARMGNPGQTNYAATKAGVEGFSRALAQEIGSRNITVNAVAPGFIATDMTEALTESQREELLARIPLGRLGTVEDIAAVVAFLASEGAAYITGATLQVNGGLHMS